MTAEGPVRLTVANPSGLHARPAALFVRTAARFAARVTVRNVTRSGPPADAKSIIGVIGTGVGRGHEIELAADGEDAGEALAALRELVESGIGEAPEGSRGEPAGGTAGGTAPAGTDR